MSRRLHANSLRSLSASASNPCSQLQSCRNYGQYGRRWYRQELGRRVCHASQARQTASKIRWMSMTSFVFTLWRVKTYYRVFIFAVQLCRSHCPFRPEHVFNSPGRGAQSHADYSGGSVSRHPNTDRLYSPTPGHQRQQAPACPPGLRWSRP